MCVDGGSDIILVTSISFLHNFMQTTNEVGNTGRADKTTHAVDLHTFLETVD